VQDQPLRLALDRAVTIMRSTRRHQTLSGAELGSCFGAARGRSDAADKCALVGNNDLEITIMVLMTAKQELLDWTRDVD
jgi:hypothetical protein